MLLCDAADCRGDQMLRTAVLLGAIVCSGGALAQGDVSLGQQVFEDKCILCHSMTEGPPKRGPLLVDMIDRPAATVEGFAYSDAMREAAEAGLVWDLETLDRFLTKPRRVVNGSYMTFTGLNHPEDVANVIAYLASFSSTSGQ